MSDSLIFLSLPAFLGSSEHPPPLPSPPGNDSWWPGLSGGSPGAVGLGSPRDPWEESFKLEPFG